MSPLPQPSPEALAHSARLRELILKDINMQGDWIPFSRYMELALYAPGLGYYTAGSHKFGSAGDFVTAPEMSPLFGRTLARQAAEIMEQSTPHILELGAGSGRLACDMLLELERLGNEVTVRTHGVRQYTLLLSPEQFDLDQPIRVTTNGKVSFEGRVERQVGTLLKWAALDRDRAMMFVAELQITVS